MPARTVAGLLAAVVLAACGGPAGRTAPTTAPPGATRPVPEVGVADASRCPVTRPRLWRPPAGVTVDALFGAGSSHGNGRLWVGGLGDGGVIRAGPDEVEPDGSVGVKLGWWREVEGSLQLSGRRLDGPAPPLRGGVPGDYGPAGFTPSGVYFPTEGCWEVTGTVGRVSLTFVTSVVKDR